MYKLRCMLQMLVKHDLPQWWLLYRPVSRRIHHLRIWLLTILIILIVYVLEVPRTLLVLFLILAKVFFLDTGDEGLGSLW